MPIVEFVICYLIFCLAFVIGEVVIGVTKRISTKTKQRIKILKGDSLYD